MKPSKEYRLERQDKGYYVCSQCGWEISYYSPNSAEWIDLHGEIDCQQEIEVIGYQTGDGMICLECGKNSSDTEAAEAKGYPDGFTCAECGKVVIW